MQDRPATAGHRTSEATTRRRRNTPTTSIGRGPQRRDVEQEHREAERRVTKLRSRARRRLQVSEAHQHDRRAVAVRREPHAAAGFAGRAIAAVARRDEVEGLPGEMSDAKRVPRSDT